MQRASDQFFTCPVFAVDQHGAVGGSHALQNIDDAVHLRTVSNHALKSKPFVEGLAEFGVAANQPQSRRCFLNGGTQFADVKRFGEICIGSVLHRRYGGSDRTVSREHNYFRIRKLFLGQPQDL